ncbi:MAG: DUF3592 domain-containing protein [Parvularculaceae bacterium]
MDRRQDLRGTAGALVLFGALVFGGMLAAYAAVTDYSQARASAEWPATDGVILSTNGNDTVRYAWFAAGRSHAGERVRFWTAALTPAGVNYGAGSKVKVFVSPDDGAIAVLEPGGSPIVFALVLGFGGFLVFIGLAGVIRLAMKLDGLTPSRRRRASDYAAAE